VFILLHFALGLSAIISTYLLAFKGFDPASLVITYISEPAYNNSHFIVFPFSEYWSTVRLGGVKTSRFVGIYREPGVAQAYFLTAYFMTHFVHIRSRKVIQGVLLIASILLFSTAGIINLLIGILALYLLNPELRPKIEKVPLRTVSVFIAIGVITVVFLTMSSELNIRVKLNQHVSGEFRKNSLFGGLDQFIEKPILGHGYYSSYREDEIDIIDSFKQTGLLSSAFEIGVIGISFYFSLWVYGVKKLGSWRTLCIYIPTLLTLLTFQATYLTAFVWFLLLINTQSYQLIISSRSKMKFFPNHGLLK
jgi:hypothetical protein